MSNVTCIVVEDEPLAIKILTDYIRQVPFLELQATFRNAVSAAAYLRDHRPQLLFLDIHLPAITGLEFLKTISDPPAVILTTAYPEYAIEGFNLQVADYLLKPFAFDRFLQAVNRVTLSLKKDLATQQAAAKDVIFLPLQKKKVRLRLSDIVYIESQKEYIRIHTTTAVYCPKLSTHEIAALLPAHQFKRVHRSFIVSLQHIHSYNAEGIEIGGTFIPIGRAYRGILDNL